MPVVGSNSGGARGGGRWKPTAHDIGLKDLLDAVQLLEYRPEVILFAVSIRGVDRSGMEPSREILDTFPKIVESILEFLT